MSLPTEAVTSAPGAAPTPTRPAWASTDDLMRDYYDHEWGVPVRDERGLFEALSLEVFQSGLSWSTILRRREAFRHAFQQFSPDAVAAFDGADVERLMADEGIVRNRRKILATIQNAGATVRLREQGGLVQLIWSFQPTEPLEANEVGAAGQVTRTKESEALAKALRSRGFTFVGPTTMYGLMQAVGLVDGKRT